MRTFEEIKQATARLSLLDRHQLIIWLSTQLDEDGVREAALSYGPPDDSPPDPRWLPTFEDYLAFEERSPIRHEYIAGQLFAMSGASESHELIALNLAAALHTHVRGGPCRAYVGNMRLKVEIGRKHFGYYPDVMVACTRDGAEKNLLRYPKLIVEVLSPSTRATDHREKWLHYTEIPTAEEYVLVSQEAAELVIHRRAGNWLSHTIRGVDASVTFASIDLTLSLAQIYENVALEVG